LRISRHFRSAAEELNSKTRRLKVNRWCRFPEF
jgi:hypothetical protein